MTYAAWVVAPLLLAIVLGFSAATKVGRGESLRSIIANLRLPAWLLPRWLAISIPGLEIALAIGLLTPWLPVFTLAALGTGVLMSAYWLLIARGLTISPRPSCGCFGQVGDQRITARTLLRNSLLLLAAVAAVLLATSGRTAWSALAAGSLGDWLWLGLAVAACVVTGLVIAGTAVRQRTAPADPGPEPPYAASPAGSEADDDYLRTPTPQLLLHDPQNGPVTLLELSQHRAQLLVFVDCYCFSTRDTLSRIEGWQERMPQVDVRMVFSVPIVHSLGPVPDGTLVDHAGLAWAALDLTRSPSAVLLGADRYLAGGPVGGTDDVHAFVDEIAQALSEAEPEAAADDRIERENARRLAQLGGSQPDVRMPPRRRSE